MQPVWVPERSYLPSRPPDSRIVAGAALAFTGFLLQGLGWLLRFFMPFDGGFLFSGLLGIGSILAAVGFLLAFLGLARPRALGVGP